MTDRDNPLKSGQDPTNSGTNGTVVMVGAVGDYGATGPNKGQCKLGGSNEPIAQYNTLSATGNVSFG